MCLYSCITTRRTPFRFGSRQYLDFTGNFEVALAKLRNHLSWLASPAGQLQAMKDRLDDAEYDRPRAVEDNARHRIDKEITELKQQIAEQQNVVDRPQEAKQRTEESITRAIERERQPENPVTGSSRTKFINPPPTLAPSYFQDCSDETTLIGTFLQDNTKRMMTIIGRGQNRARLPGPQSGGEWALVR